MRPEEFQTLYPLVFGWIQQTLASHLNSARTVNSVGLGRLPRYFSKGLLSSTKVVIVDRVPIPPLSSMGLNQFAEFESGNYNGVTYLDTFFVRRDSASTERLYFHELIHAVQWQLLGAERFLAAYALGLETAGYRDSPLEVMAYNAEDAFARSDVVFDAERLVAEQLGQMLGAAS